MSKKSFLEKLRKKLSILNKSEIEDIIDEYGSYIDEKVKKGKTEEESIQDFGNFDELVKEILSAYKINEDFDEEAKVSNVIVNLFDDIVTTVDTLVKRLNDMGSDAIIKFIFEMMLVIVCLVIFRFPFDLIIDMGREMFNVLPDFISSIFSGIWHFIIEIIYLVLAVVIFVKYFKEHYIFKQEDDIKEKNNTNEIKKDEKKITINKNSDKKEKNYVPVNSLSGFSNILAAIGKAFAILFAIPTVFTLISLVILFIISLFLIGFGIQFIGIPMIIFSFILAAGTFLEILFKIIASNKKINIMKIFIEIMIIIVLFGVGCALCVMEFASSTYTNTLPDKYELTTKKYDFSMDDMNKYYFGDYFTKYIVDESLTDKVVVEMTFYSDFVSLELDEHYNYYSYWLNHRVNFNGKAFFDILKEDIKNKEFYDYSLLFNPQYIVYSSKDNLEKITKNNYRYEDISQEHLIGNMFKRTYSILNVNPVDENDGYYLTVAEVGNASTTSLAYVEEFKFDLQADSVYDFTFRITNSDIEDDINSIFENSKIVHVELNNGLKIYQDSVY